MTCAPASKANAPRCWRTSATSPCQRQTPCSAKEDRSPDTGRDNPEKGRGASASVDPHAQVSVLRTGGDRRDDKRIGEVRAFPA